MSTVVVANHPGLLSTAQTHRLLYRGALSLPDSHLLLDGLSFSTEIAHTDSAADLLHNPLALALESMRGRTSLRLLGTVSLSDTWLDEAGAVTVDLHPRAALSRMYFTNVLCVTPSASGVRTALGIRVSLSDSDDPSTTDILIYGQIASAPPSSPSTSTSAPTTLRLLAARILPAPPPARPPRPDDPTPRRPVPPTKRKREPALELHAKRSRRAGARADEEVDEDTLRHAREVMTRMPMGKAQEHAPGGNKGRDKGKAREGSSSSDVFKIPQVPAHLVGSDEMEKENKNVVKRAAVRCLADYGVEKGCHAEFTELFQLLYRGTAFALRKTMRTEPVDVAAMRALLDAHARMYVLPASLQGGGGSAGAGSAPART